VGWDERAPRSSALAELRLVAVAAHARPAQGGEPQLRLLVRAARFPRRLDVVLVEADGQLQREAGALSRIAGHGDLAAQEPRVPLRDTETQAGSAHAPGVRTLDLPEGIEDPAHLLGLDADAGVTDIDRGAIPLDACPEGYRPAGGEFDRIGQKVDQDLPRLSRIRLDPGLTIADVDLEREILRLRERLCERRRLLHERAECQPLQVHLLGAGLQAREPQHLLDELEQLPGARPD